jgi:hypothetical protein
MTRAPSYPISGYVCIYLGWTILIILAIAQV